jgi:hypothetical protein
MALTLNSARFAGVPQLEAALNDTTDSHVIFDGGVVLPRSNGPHVRLLQESLLAMGFPLPQYGADSDFGTESTIAVSMFQIEGGVERRLDLPDRTELIDGKVGRDVMGVFDLYDPGPTVGSFTAVQTGVEPRSVTFAESPAELYSGFDATTDPPSLVLGATTRRRVVAELEPPDAEVEYLVDDPAVAEVALTPDGIVVTGLEPGVTMVSATFDGVIYAVLEVVVKAERAEIVNFFYVTDSADPRHASSRLVSQAGALTSRLNRVWRRQANVHFTLGQAIDIVVPVALGDVVRDFDLDTFSPFAVSGQLNMFLVWEYEPVEFDPKGGGPVIDTDGVTAVPRDPALPVVSVIEDSDCDDVLTVPHEAGHYLGFQRRPHAASGIMSTCNNQVERPRVSRELADLVNP